MRARKQSTRTTRGQKKGDREQGRAREHKKRSYKIKEMKNFCLHNKRKL